MKAEVCLKTVSSAQSIVRWGSGIAVEAVSNIPGRIFAIVDENFATGFPDFVKTLSENEQVVVERLPSGERFKTFETAIGLVGKLANLRFTRSDSVLAVGGGVATDLSGFVASLYQRGLCYHSLPTSLLAMVDASIGGKCGVDLAQGKNLAGAFYQPKTVTADLDFLATLPAKEIRNGMGEILKYGIIADKSLLDLCEDFEHNKEEILSRCIKIKCGIVATDERESGGRMILNFGHTIGHAFEKIGGYERFSHGECVANGMIFESRLLECAGLVSPSDVAFVEATVKRFGLLLPQKWNVEQVLDAMLSDKKRRGETLHFAGFSQIGVGRVFSFTTDQITELLTKIL